MSVTLRLPEKKVMMIMELEAKKIFDLATILEHLTEFHGSPLPSPFFFLLWGRSFSSLHSSSLQATWRAINPKLLAFSRLAYFLSYQDFTRLGLHITLGEVPQVTGSPPYPLTDYRIVFVVICNSICLFLALHICLLNFIFCHIFV